MISRPHERPHRCIGIASIDGDTALFDALVGGLAQLKLCFNTMEP